MGYEVSATGDPQAPLAVAFQGARSAGAPEEA